MHGVGQEILPDFDCPTHRFHGDFLFSRCHIRGMEQSRDSQDSANVLCRPVWEYLPILDHESFVFLKIPGDDFLCFFGQYQRFRFFSCRQSHQPKNQIAVLFPNFAGDSGRAEGAAADSGGGKGIQESSQQPPAYHGGVCHDAVQHIGLHRQNCRQAGMGNVLGIPAHSVN